MARYSVMLNTPEGRTEVIVEAPENASQADISQAAMAQIEGSRPAPTQATHGLPSLTGVSPAGAELPLMPEVPYAPIPQPQAEATRMTPRSETPLQAAQAATATEGLRLATGMERLGALALGEFGESAAAKRRLGQLGEEQAERFKQYPLPTLAGTAAPYTLLPQSTVATLPRAMGTGAALAAIAEGGEPVEGAKGAMGGALGYGIGRLLSGPVNQLNPAQRRDIAVGKRMGYRTLPSQETGSRAYQRIESGMESSPLMQGTVRQAADENQSLLNKIAMESIGEEANYIDVQLIGRAHDRIRDTIKDVAGRTSARIDDLYLDALAAAEENITRNVAKSGDTKQLISKSITEILNLAENGKFSGQALRKISSDTGQEANRLFRSATGDKDVARAFSEISDATDELIRRNASAEDMDALTEALEQWGNYKLLQKPGAIRGTDVSGKSLHNILNRERPSYRLGRRVGEAETPRDRLYASARFYSAMPEGYGSSGTAERLAPAQLGAAWYGGTQMTGEPVTGAVAGFGLPAIASKLYGSRWPWATGLFGLPAETTPGISAGAGIGASSLLGQ